MNVIKIDSFYGEYRWLSNFWLSKFIINNKQYKSVEHFYQASKMLDEDSHEFILNLDKPSSTKKLVNDFP